MVKSKKPNPRIREKRKILSQVDSSHYKYKTNKDALSVDERLLLGSVVDSLRGEDGEVNIADLTLIWFKIKKSMREDLRKGHHKSKLFQLNICWNNYKEYFIILLTSPFGVFGRFMDLYKRSFDEFPDKKNVIKMVREKLLKWLEI